MATAARRPVREAAPKPRNDAYTGLLLISFLALMVSAVLLYLDYSAYGPNSPPKPQVGAPGGSPAGPGPGGPGDLPKSTPVDGAPADTAPAGGNPPTSPMPTAPAPTNPMPTAPAGGAGGGPGAGATPIK